jgi:DNA replication protein DnaC
VVRQLSSCRWVEEQLSIVITGATGTGKTYLACAFAQQACRKGFRVLYRRVPRLLEELTLARADGSWARVLARFARADVLVLDDWGIAPLRDSERRDLIEVIEDREGLRSTILASQVPVSRWHDHIGDPTVADALCDRILHRAHRIELKGPSRGSGQRSSRSLQTERRFAPSR